MYSCIEYGTGLLFGQIHVSEWLYSYSVAGAVWNTTIRIWFQFTMRPNTNGLFGTLFNTKANIKRTFGTTPIYIVSTNSVQRITSLGKL